MRLIHKEHPFFIGCIAPYENIWPKIDNDLYDFIVNCIGTIGSVWPPTDIWHPPESYQKEMGKRLSTVIIVFDKICQKLDLVNIKRATIIAEKRMSDNGSRKYNLNPGYVDVEGLFLATHKSSPIRTRIADDVWIEKQLCWSGSTLVPMKNTFSEYSDMDRLIRFNKLMSRSSPSGLRYELHDALVAEYGIDDESCVA